MLAAALMCPDPAEIARASSGFSVIPDPPMRMVARWVAWEAAEATGDPEGDLDAVGVAAGEGGRQVRLIVVRE